MSDVVETGHDFETIQRNMLKNFRKGIRDNKELNKVTKTGLQTAYLLDANAENTADMFAHWHQSLGMSSTDLRSMQRGMTQIAKSTGLVGDNLIDAAKSASEFMDNMRKAGTLTAESSRSLIEMMARAKLTGTEGAAKSFAKILSQGRLRGNLSGHEQTLAAIGGGGNTKLIDAITFGTVQGNKELEKEFANNLEGWMKAQVGGDPTKSLAQNMKKMSAEQISRLSYLTQQLFGMGAKEFQLQIKNMQKGAQSFSENIAELEKAGSAEAMTLKQLQDVADKEVGWRMKFDAALGKAGGDTSKALDELLNMRELPPAMRKQFEGQLNAQQVAYQRQHLFITTGADLMDKFNNIMEDGGKNVDGALEELARGSKDFREYLTKVGTDATKGGMAIEKVLEDQAKRLTEEANKFGMGEDISKLLPDPADIKKALKDNDKAALKIIADRFARAKGMIETGSMKNTSPMELIKQYLNQIAGMFNELMQAGLKEVLPMLMHAIKDFSKAPFWKAFKEGDLKKGFELFGEYIKSIVPNVQKAMAEIGSLAESEGFRKFLATLISGIATAVKPLLDAIGAAFAAENPKIMKFVEEVKKFINETDWNKVAEGLAAIAAGFVKLVEAVGTVVEALGPKGTLIAGLALLTLTLGTFALGINPVVLALGAGALALGHFKSELDKMVKDRTKEIDKNVEARVVKTDATIAARAVEAPKMSDEDIKAKIAASDRRIRELTIVANDATKEMADNLTSFGSHTGGRIASALGVDSSEVIAEGMEKALNSITKAQNDERRLIKQMQDELMRRSGEGKDIPKLTVDLDASARHADAVANAMSNRWVELNKASGGTEVNVDYLRKDEAGMQKIAELTGKTRDEIKELLDKYHTIWGRRGTSDNAGAQAEINRLMNANPEMEKLQAEQKFELSKKVGLEEALKKAKAAAAVPPPPPPPPMGAGGEIKLAVPPAAADVDKKLGVMADKAAKPGSIFTHDIHTEEVQTSILESINNIGETMLMANDMLMKYMNQELDEAMKAGTVTARVPIDAEQELRKREAELRGAGGADMSATEANTGQTAANTRATAKAVNMLGKLMAKFLASNSNGLSGLSGPDYSIDTFFDEALSTTWHSANPDRQPGLDVDGH